MYFSQIAPFPQFLMFWFGGKSAGAGADAERKAVLAAGDRPFLRKQAVVLFRCTTRCCPGLPIPLGLVGWSRPGRFCRVTSLLMVICDGLNTGVMRISEKDV